MRNLLGFDPEDDRSLDGLTEALPRVFEMPEDRPTMSFRAVSADEPAQRASGRPAARRTSAGRNPRPNRAYIIVTALAVLAIVVSGAWAVDSARWNGTSSSAAAVAAANAPLKTTKAKKSKRKSRRKSRKSSKTTTAQAPTKAAATNVAAATKSASAGGMSVASAATGRSGGAGPVVVIDAGHQGQGDSSTEPIGPGASTRKAKVTSGGSGVYAPHDESEINLEVALKLRSVLQARGVHVIMVRTSQNVNIANSARAEIANKAHAALFVRIHCDDVSDSSLHGFSTLIPARNQWTGPIVDSSAKAGHIVQAAALKATGAADHGVVDRGDLTGFNWCKVPAVLVEMGFMSNRAEDKLLTTSSYQDKLATGIANGVVSYLKG